jgi:Fe-S-cluster containining protein
MLLSELAGYALQFSQRDADSRAQRAQRAGLAVTCRKGCGACCRQPVPLSPPEAWMIAGMVRSLEEPQRARVLARFRDAAASLASNGMEGAALLSEAVAYFRLGIACPFLESESCGIHPHRPSACRDYLVTSPAYMCSEPMVHPVSILPVRRRISECLSDIAGRLLGWGRIMIPLVRSLEWAAEHEAEGKRSWDADFLKSLLREQLLSTLRRR